MDCIKSFRKSHRFLERQLWLMLTSTGSSLVKFPNIGSQWPYQALLFWWNLLLITSLLELCVSLLWDCVWSRGNYCSFLLWILIGKGIRWVGYGSLWMPQGMETTEFHSLKVVRFSLGLILWVNRDKKAVELSPSKLVQYVHARAAIRSVADVNWHSMRNSAVSLTDIR